MAPLSSSDSQMSLAAQARSQFPQAKPSRDEGTRPHKCSGSRCGLVSATSPSPAAKPAQVAGSAASPKAGHSSPKAVHASPRAGHSTPKAGHSTPKGKNKGAKPPARAPGAALPQTREQPSQMTLKQASFRQRGSSARLTPLVSLVETSPMSVDVPATPTFGDMPASPQHSPTNIELTESVLQKSQNLLKQLSELNLDSPSEICGRGHGDNHNSTHDIDTESIYSQEPSCKSKDVADVETIEVPVVLLKVLADTWEEMRSPKSSPLPRFRTLDSREEMRSPKSSLPWRSPKDSLPSPCTPMSRFRTMGNHEVFQGGSPKDSLPSPCSPMSRFRTMGNHEEFQGGRHEAHKDNLLCSMASVASLASTSLGPSVSELGSDYSSASPQSPGTPPVLSAVPPHSPRLAFRSTRMSPTMQGGMLQHMCPPSPATSIQQSLQQQQKQQPLQHRLTPSGSQMISLAPQAHIPRGSSVSISVTTSQTITQTQTFNLLAL